VEDSPDLWEAAARRVSTTFFNYALITTLTALARERWVLLKMNEPRDTGFWSEVGRILLRWMAAGMDSGFAIIHNAVVDAYVL
jgi:hypothetical protein